MTTAQTAAYGIAVWRDVLGWREAPDDINDGFYCAADCGEATYCIEHTLLAFKPGMLAKPYKSRR